MRHAHEIESAEATATSAGRLAAATPSIAAALLGFFILYGVGFAAIPALHNAAHDARHSFGFPCH